MGVERRKHKRVRLNGEVRVTYKTAESSVTVTETVAIKDISLGGALITARVPYPLSLELTLEATLPAGPAEAEGTVIRIVEIGDNVTYDLGVQFTRISDDNLRRLQEFIQ